MFVLGGPTISSTSCDSFHELRTNGAFPCATGTILKVICKAKEQDLRMAILSKEGFQQVQVQATIHQQYNCCMLNVLLSVLSHPSLSGGC